MFDFIFDREKSKVYLDVLADLQDVLGRLNDNTVAHRLADSLDSKARHEVIALVHEVIEHDVDELNTEFAKAWKRFTSQDIYWKRPRERNRK
jgi:CHAD domain-containing protein